MYDLEDEDVVRALDKGKQPMSREEEAEWLGEQGTEVGTAACMRNARRYGISTRHRD